MTLSRKMWIIAGLALCFLAGTEAAFAQDTSYETIFRWVSAELKIDKEYPMPVIHRVSRETLQELFRQHNEKSYKQWVKDFGEDKAREALNLYLREVIGLFNPESKVIYVGGFMEPCKFDAIVAHEITHYFQIVAEGAVDSGWEGLGEIKFFRELQAEALGEKYVKTFCGGQTKERKIASTH